MFLSMEVLWKEWSIVSGCLCSIAAADNALSTLSFGHSFGITPTMEKLYHKGVMKTVKDDCQFVCITQTDYYKILSEGE